MAYQANHADAPKKARRTDAEIADAHRRDADYRDARAAADRAQSDVYRFWTDAIAVKRTELADTIAKAKEEYKAADAKYDAAITLAKAKRDGTPTPASDAPHGASEALQGPATQEGE